MKEAFSQRQEVRLNLNNNESKQENQKKKKTPVKQETLKKLAGMGVDVSKIYFEEDAQAIIEEKQKSSEQTKTPKRNKKDQIRFEAIVLANSLDIPVSESVGTKAILESIKEKIETKKSDAGHDIALMADALSYEVSYKAICDEFEVYNNTTTQLGCATLADYNRYRLGL